VPSLHFPLQTHNRPPSPPQFRDLNLPTAQTRRPDEILAPSSVFGVLPDSIDGDRYVVPFRTDRNGFGTRVPPHPQPLNTFPGRHQVARNGT
jgi:hypothetical protein